MFLSNFYPAEVELDGGIYRTVEHAYQAAKTLDLVERRQIQKARTPGVAKKMGRGISIRTNWEDIKVSIMYQLVKQKFTNHPLLMEKLLDTEDAELIEGNDWGDLFWGVCNRRGYGFNHLGRILMKVREEAL